MVATNNLVSSPLRDSVLETYWFSVLTGHRLILPGNDGKKNSAIGFPWRDCLASPRGRKVTPSGLGCLLATSNCDKSADLDGRVNARRKAVFHVRCFSERDSVLPMDSMWLSTCCTFHVLEYLGRGGLSLYIPFTSLTIVGCCPMTKPSTFSCTDEIAER